MEAQRERFHHPFTPYDIQLQFMRALYTCLEERKVAVFESPTGTGKSLSLICGSLTWLRDHKRKLFEEAVNTTACDDGDPDWMLDFARRESSRKISQRRRDFEERLAKTRRNENRLKQQELNTEQSKKRQKFDSTQTQSASQDEKTFELEDYDSENEDVKKEQTKSDVFGGLSASTLALLERFKGQAAMGTTDEDDDVGMDVKIFYCSRTHSQLSQFARELQRVSFPSSLPRDHDTSDNRDGGELGEQVKHLSLGSRKNLCINPKVLALDNATAINERCMELQQSGVAADKKCPHLPSKETEATVLEFRDHTLATVKDIEDIGRVGKRLGVCPYYGSRSVIKHSEIVTLPYPLLLQRSAREALNLSVKDHVVIIDEAHNLMDAVSSIHSATVTLSQMQTAISQLTTYARKFQNRLKGKNRNYVSKVIRLINSIVSHLKTILGGKGPLEGSVEVSALMAGKGVDQINPYKLSRYLHESKLARKVDGYIDFSNQRTDSLPKEKPTVPVLFHIQSFLLSLMNPSSEGRFFYAKCQGDVELKYMLLDPTSHFKEIVEDARAVILAGGTMSPMSDYRSYLFSYVPASRLETFSFGHVIPPDNLTAQALVKGIQGLDFDFTYDARTSEKMIIDLGRTIASLCEVIPDGVVAFFPSYDYLTYIVNIWKRPHTAEQGQTILGLLETKKPVLFDSRSAAAKTEDLLRDYSTAIESGSGALLLSVVGGKLSEGINFSDNLGRGVLIIGLPFPNIRSAVWQAKIKYIEGKAYELHAGPEESRKLKAKAAGKDFYENACMRAVNQCIGRAIRHRDDYAAIVMIDRRYATQRIQTKLPAWIKQGLVADSAIRPAGEAVRSLSRFFGRKACR